MEPVIELEKVSAGYGDVTVLKDISVKIKPGKITVILGGSGCGKSTLLKTILRLKDASAGRITMLGKNVVELREGEYHELLKNVGVLFQNGALLNSMTLYENVIIPLEQHTGLPSEVADRMVRVQLDHLGLGMDLWKLPGELSGGMRKRAALARALILSPSILFCDEPSAGLDPVTSARIDELLLGLRDQLDMSIVVVTHELDSIRRIAGDLIFLDQGNSIFQGTLEEAMATENEVVRDFFRAGEGRSLDFCLRDGPD